MKLDEAKAILKKAGYLLEGSMSLEDKINNAKNFNSWNNKDEETRIEILKDLLDDGYEFHDDNPYSEQDIMGDFYDIDDLAKVYDEVVDKLEDLYEDAIGMMDREIAEFLEKAVIARCNIVISGKGGSGKTTLMRNLINKIPEDMSITSCEETAELYSTHPNIIQREILSNRSKDKNISLADLTAHALVMSNDCIVVGELKNDEAMAFFDAISTGHVGYATVHSDSSKNTANRLVTLMKRDYKAQLYSDKYLRKMLAESLDLIIYMNNFKVQEITEVLYDQETDDISYNPLYEFKVSRYEKGKSIGKFRKINKPSGRVKTKIDLNKSEIERVANIC